MPISIADREKAAHTQEVGTADALKQWTQAARAGMRVIYFRSTRPRSSMKAEAVFKQAAKLADQKAIALFQRPVLTPAGVRFEYLAVRTIARTHQRISEYMRRFDIGNPDVFAFLTADPMPPYRPYIRDTASLEEFV